jgi:hypothetical protein
MRIEQSYPAPVHGISTLAPRTRPQGYASKQVNFRSDPVNKLTRRPPSLYKADIAGVTDPSLVLYHSYERGGKDYSFVVDKSTGLVSCTVDDVVVNTFNLGAYNGTNLGLFTIEHDTYVVNRDVTVAKLSLNDSALVEKVSHINVTSALNYGETIQINITKPTGERYSVTYTIPDLGTTEPDYDAADKARATKQVALQLAARINGGGTHAVNIPNPDYTGDTLVCTTPYIYTDAGGGFYTRSANGAYNPTASICEPYLSTYAGIAGVTAQALGSTVAIWLDGKADWLQVEVESGQGDRTTVAINQIVESTDGLPLYAVVGTRITVRPDPTSEKGIYYLQAERISDTATGEELEEVVWSEDRSPIDAHSFDITTLPHKIKFNGATFDFSTIPYKSRQTGDDESTPFPKFVGQQIQSLGYFQKRLVVVAENAVYMTETDDLRNWFRQSAVALLVTDPIEVTTSELGADKLLHLVPHNRDLLCIASNSQFKLTGTVALTPETVSMPLTTKYECQTSVAPVAIGNSVYFPIDYGDSTGLQEYTGEQNTSQDFATPVTNHVIDYLKGKATLLAASPNLEMIAMTTSNTPDNTIFIYEQYTEAEGKRSQQAWSEWTFAAEEVIVDLRFRRNALVVLVAVDGRLIVKTLPMYTRVTASPLDVYLDDMLILQTTGTTVTVPVGYSTTGCVAVRGTGTQNELWKVTYTRTGDVLTFDEDIGVGTVYVGRIYTSSYEPTRPFKYDEDGSTITTDKIRIGGWIMSLVDTHELSMTKTSNHASPVTSKFEARFVNQYPLGTVSAYTGDYKFSFSEEAGLATALFFTSSYLGCTISSVAWEGQYFQSKQRMK